MKSNDCWCWYVDLGCSDAQIKWRPYVAVFFGDDVYFCTCEIKGTVIETQILSFVFAHSWGFPRPWQVHSTCLVMSSLVRCQRFWKVPESSQHLYYPYLWNPRQWLSWYDMWAWTYVIHNPYATYVKCFVTIWIFHPYKSVSYNVGWNVMEMWRNVEVREVSKKTILISKTFIEMNTWFW